MRIDNREYLDYEIKDNIMEYIIKDKDKSINMEKLEENIYKIYENFIRFLREKYKIKNIDFIKSKFMEYEIKDKLLDYIEDIIY